LAKNTGKNFEEELKTSAAEQGIFFYRIKDVNPMFLKANARVSKNDFDSFIYKKPNLFPIEFKSTGNRSISFDEKIIKQHQIDALKDAVEYDGLIAGFIFNFREYDNFTCFVHINDFLEIQHLSQSKISEHRFKSKLNKSSIGLDICKEVGIEIHNVKKKVKHRYYIGNLLDELIEKYNSLETNIHT
jgi:penicillin-binding protein-related factor A (putative recombinase)